MPKDIYFHKVNDIGTDTINKVADQSNIYFQRDGRIYVDNIAGEPIEMAPAATTGKKGMVTVSDDITDLTDPTVPLSVVPSVKLLQTVRSEILSPESDTTFNGKIILNPDEGLVFPETVNKTIPSGKNGIMGGPGQSDPTNASMNIYSQDRIDFSPSEDGGIIKPGQSAFSINAQTGDVYVSKRLYVNGKEINPTYTGPQPTTPSPTGPLPKHQHSWNDLHQQTIPVATDTLRGIVHLTSEKDSASKSHAVSGYALSQVRREVDEKLSADGGKITGILDFDVSSSRKIRLANDDYISYDDTTNTIYFESEDSVNKSILKAGAVTAVNYLVVGPQAKRVYVQSTAPTGANAGDVWIQT